MLEDMKFEVHENLGDYYAMENPFNWGMIYLRKGLGPRLMTDPMLTPPSDPDKKEETPATPEPLPPLLEPTPLGGQQGDSGPGAYP